MWQGEKVKVSFLLHVPASYMTGRKLASCSVQPTRLDTLPDLNRLPDIVGFRREDFSRFLCGPFDGNEFLRPRSFSRYRSATPASLAFSIYLTLRRCNARNTRGCIEGKLIDSTGQQKMKRNVSPVGGNFNGRNTKYYSILLD